MVDTLLYLKRGGRITPAAAALGTILKIKPVLQIQGEKLDAFAKARTTAQGKQIMMNAIKMTSPNASERSQSRQTCGLTLHIPTIMRQPWISGKKSWDSSPDAKAMWIICH